MIMTHLRFHFIVFALVALILSGHPCQSQEVTPADATKENSPESYWPGLEGEAFEKTAELFSKKCAMCHELDGNSEDYNMNLVDGAWLHGNRPIDIQTTIREGVPGTDMQSFKDKYDAQQISNLAKYIKYLEHQMQIQQMAMDFDAAARVMAGVPAPDSTEAAAPTPDLSQLPKLLSITLVPENPTLWGKEASQRFQVQGSFEDGIKRDVTTLAKFSLSDMAVGELGPGQYVTGKADGECALKVTLNGLSDETILKVEGSEEAIPFSFARDIGAIFTNQGCNASSCHGGVKGRGRFKLSIGVLQPRDDYEWITQGGGYQVLTDEVLGERIPRINEEDPENSLILLKPTLTVSHGGGKRFGKDSEAYQTLVEWVRNGAPFKEEGADDLRIERLEVHPNEAVLDREAAHQLLVTAHLANGRSEDITDQVRFESNNPEVATVSSGGLVRATGLGETEVLVWASGARSHARFGVIGKTVEDFPEIPRNNLIDEHVFAKLEKYHIVPSELTDDSNFLRRVCLDLTGTLPPPSRVQEFLADSDPKKREKVIDTLMNSPEYIEYWVYRFCDFFRVRYGGGVGGGDSYWGWMRKNIAQNRPYNEIVWDRIACQGTQGAARFHAQDVTVAPRAAEDVRVFLGRRLDCAECHNHPSEVWSQNQFWGLAAFYGQMTFVEFSILYDDPEGHEHPYGDEGKETLEFKQITNPRTKASIAPTFLTGKPISEDVANDPRKALADWITSHPYFAETIVNRLWRHFFHRGIVDPVDDFSSKHLPSHPKLLKALAKDFKNNGYNVKQTIRLIVSSRTYQLSSIPNESNHHDLINFSHAIPRPLDAEVLMDAVATVTGVPPVFDRSLAPISGLPKGKAPRGTKAIQLMDPLSYPSRFLEVYGRPTRLAIPERNAKPNLDQALHTWVGETYTERLGLEGGRLHGLSEGGATIQEVVEEFYLAALSRSPSEGDVQKVEDFLSEKSSFLVSSFFGTSSKRREIFEDFIWGLVTSREFAYNH